MGDSVTDNIERDRAQFEEECPQLYAYVVARERSRLYEAFGDMICGMDRPLAGYLWRLAERYAHDYRTQALDGVVNYSFGADYDVPSKIHTHPEPATADLGDEADETSSAPTMNPGGPDATETAP